MTSKKYTVYWSNSAQDDMSDLVDYISSDSPEIAETLFKKIKTESDKLEKFPERGRIIPELESHNIFSYRELIVSPWRIIYKIDENSVYILALIDGRRNILDIILKRIMKN